MKLAGLARAAGRPRQARLVAIRPVLTDRQRRWPTTFHHLGLVVFVAGRNGWSVDGLQPGVLMDCKKARVGRTAGR